MKKVEIFDTSMRDWFQWSKKIAKIEDKIQISKQLDNFWVDMIEVWFAIASSDDFSAIEQVSDFAKARIFSLSRSNKIDIDKSAEAVRNAKHKWIHTFIWTSPTHREKLNKDEKKILEAIKKYVNYTHDVMKWNWVVMFSPEDALRTEHDFLLQTIEQAVRYWAEIINIPDTVWFAQSWEIKELIKDVRSVVWDNVKISIHTHNDLWNASSNSLAAVESGVDIIQWTFPPLFGERAWNADLVQIITNLIKRQDYYNVKLNKKIILENLYPLVSKVSEISWVSIPEKFPIVWRWVHRHGSWIHQDGVNKRTDTYEILSPEEIWLKREQSFFLTNLSGRAWLKNAIKKYFLIDIKDDEINEFYDDFLKTTTRKDYIEMDDVRELLISYWYNLEKNVTIDDYDISINYGKQVLARAVFWEDHIMWEWVWPVDAIFNIIKQKYDTNNEVELIDFTIEALGKKTDVTAKVYIKLKIWDEIYEEEALSGDIVKASMKAFLNGMDRILRDKKIDNN